MTFGWWNGPPEFQHAMQEILSPYLWTFTLIYIDNIVVYSKTFEDHLKCMDSVLKAIAALGLIPTQMPPGLPKHSHPRQQSFQAGTFYSSQEAQGYLGTGCSEGSQEAGDLSRNGCLLRSLHSLLLLDGYTLIQMSVKEGNPF
jgi:hypothetical protein